MSEKELFYSSVRAKWAFEQRGEFKTRLCKDIPELKDESKGELLEEICRVCVDVLKFGYPAEYRLAELLTLTTDDDMESDVMLPYTKELVKTFRLDFQAKRNALIEEMEVQKA